MGPGHNEQYNVTQKKQQVEQKNSIVWFPLFLTNACRGISDKTL